MGVGGDIMEGGFFHVECVMCFPFHSRFWLLPFFDCIEAECIICVLWLNYLFLFLFCG